MSAFMGKIKEFPQISIDRFDGRNLASTAYFLSHAHSDHMIGLSSPQFLDHLESNSGVYLYCSPITARFLQASIRHRPLSPYIYPLQLEESVKITIPNVVEEATHKIFVTIIPAAHCPGSVMFLFDGRGGTVLYTGDFRISVGDVAQILHLHNQDGSVKLLDSLHIDTTFCHRDIMHFPSREESALAIGDLVEEWLAKSASTGITHLIHLLCPATYGYEYIYQGLYERFGRPIHVSRWKYRMYDTVPEIQSILTLETKDTWIHACDFRVKSNDCNAEDSNINQIPCMCPPHGVVGEPEVRVIKPSAMFYSIYQSNKMIMHCSPNGKFCRVLLSMHASCSEVLDLVSYLRPRKVFPNVIPMDSTKEEVLKLLHEALNRSGDHYSIEYGNNGTLGSFKRQLNTFESAYSSSDSTNLLDLFFTSPNKKRRHSDSNMKLVLPTPRGNIKGSLSLESNALKIDPLGPSPSLCIMPTDFGTKANTYAYKTCPPSPSRISKSCSSYPTLEDELDTDLTWQDPYILSTEKLDSSNSVNSISGSLFFNGSLNTSKNSSVVLPCTKEMREQNPMIANCNVYSSISVRTDSLDSNVFSNDCERDKFLETTGPVLSDGTGANDARKSRRLWYKHKHFSTPIHEESNKFLKLPVGPSMCPRSSSLPLPDQCNLMISQELFVDSKKSTLPLNTVSSTNHITDSQTSDDKVVTIFLSGNTSSEQSEPNITLERSISKDGSGVCKFNLISLQDQSSFCSIRPSVICAPSSRTKENEEINLVNRGDPIIINQKNENNLEKWLDLGHKKSKINLTNCFNKEKDSMVEFSMKPSLTNTITALSNRNICGIVKNNISNRNNISSLCLSPNNEFNLIDLESDIGNETSI